MFGNKKRNDPVQQPAATSESKLNELRKLTDKLGSFNAALSKTGMTIDDYKSLKASAGEFEDALKTLDAHEADKTLKKR